MQTRVKVARTGLALLFVLTPGIFAIQGCASQVPSATASLERSASGSEYDRGGESTPFVDVASIGEPTGGDMTQEGYEAAVASGVDGAIEAYGTYRDGVYTASANGKCGPVSVTVTVADGRIAKITVGANSESQPMAQKAQQTVVPQILDTQSVEDIDMATGATLTSEAIVAATASALERALW